MPHPITHTAIIACLSCLLAAAPARAAGVSPDEASWADTNTATNKYKAGKAAYDAGKLEEALARFRESYEAVASPNSHLMVARVLIDLKRHVAAYEELALVIEEAENVEKKREKYAQTAEAARALRKELEQQLGFVEIAVPAKVSIKGEPIPPAKWGEPIPVAAGAVAVDLELPDGTKQTRELTVAAGTTAKLEVQPASTPAPAATPTRRCPKPERAPSTTPVGTVKQSTVGYVAGGIGAAGLVTFTVFGVLDNQRHRDLEAACQDGVCPASLADDAERGRTYQSLANVGLGVGLVGLGAGAVLVLTTPRAERTTARAPRPQLALGVGSIGLKGKF